MGAIKLKYYERWGALEASPLFVVSALERKLTRKKADVKTYPYGFQGMERDDEVSGSGNSYDFGARMYNSRLGRWFSTDAFEADYAPLSTYGFAADNPIRFIDPDGNRIGNPFAKTTRRYKKILKSTELGKMLWKSMRKDKRKFYFHNFSKDFKSPKKTDIFHPNELFAEVIVGYAGKVFFDEQYKSAFTTDPKDGVEFFDFDANTGMSVPKPGADDKIHIVINEDQLREAAEEFAEMGIDFGMDPEFKEDMENSNYVDNLVQTLFEEVWHAAKQNEVDLFVVEKDPKTGQYKKSDNLIPYDDRNHENEAKDKADEGTKQYFENESD